MANSDYTEGASADIELARLATALIDEHNEQARADLAARIVRVAARAAKDSQPVPSNTIGADAADEFKGFDTDIYYISPDATKAEVKDYLHIRLMQLEAMLIMTYGSSDDEAGFNQWSADVKDRYLWGCASLAKECKALAYINAISR